MDPYQAWRRGLISYNTYLLEKDKGNIDVNEDASTAIILTGNMSVRDNETWNVEVGETALGYIGPTYDLQNAGTMHIDGDVLFYTSGKGLEITGALELAGSLEIKPY